jgi:acyl-CoA thioester hydrolase
VRYPETDRMGVAYHGNYLVWFELGRTELMRELGCPYGVLEERDGIYFPVIEAGVKYLSPARYDDLLSVDSRLVSVGGVRVRFEYRLTREGEGKLLATGFTVHAAVDRKGRPLKLPRELRGRLEGATCRD